MKLNKHFKFLYMNSGLDIMDFGYNRPFIEWFPEVHYNEVLLCSDCSINCGFVCSRSVMFVQLHLPPDS